MMAKSPLNLPLKLEQVSYKHERGYGVRDVDLEINSGEMHIILGPNGAGKSLLLGLCHGLYRPTSGMLSWGGETYIKTPKKQSMVFSQPKLLRRTVAENMTYIAKIRMVKNYEAVEELLSDFELVDKKEQPVSKLSTGEAQRLAFAMAMVGEPDVVFLDEPTANLDPQQTLKIELMIQRAHQGGVSILMTSHDMSQVKRLGGHVHYMQDGYILEQRDAASLTRDKEPDGIIQGFMQD